MRQSAKALSFSVFAKDSSFFVYMLFARPLILLAALRVYAARLLGPLRISVYIVNCFHRILLYCDGILPPPLTHWF